MVLVQKELYAAYIGEWYLAPTSISLDKSSITLTTVGQTEQLTATILPADARQTVSWTSSDTSIATVDENGLVTCVTPGTCTITATTVNGLTATCGVQAIPGIDLLTNVKYYYTMMGDIKDYSGNNADLTVNYGTVTYGTNYNTLSSAVLRAAGGVTYTGGAQTIGIWCKLSSGNSEFFSAGYDGLGNGWGMGIKTTLSQIVVSGAAYSTGSYSTLQDSNWHLMILTYNGSAAYLYKDGSQITSVSRSRSVRSTQGISIGRFGYSSTYYTGSIGITFLTNSTMSASDVTAFYNATKSIYGK